MNTSVYEMSAFHYFLDNPSQDSEKDDFEWSFENKILVLSVTAVLLLLIACGINYLFTRKFSDSWGVNRDSSLIIRFPHPFVMTTLFTFTFLIALAGIIDQLIAGFNADSQSVFSGAEYSHAFEGYYYILAACVIVMSVLGFYSSNQLYIDRSTNTKGVKAWRDISWQNQALTVTSVLLMLTSVFTLLEATGATDLFGFDYSEAVGEELGLCLMSAGTLAFSSVSAFTAYRGAHFIK